MEKISLDITIDSDREKVWSVITDVENSVHTIIRNKEG